MVRKRRTSERYHPHPKGEFRYDLGCHPSLGGCQHDAQKAQSIEEAKSPWQQRQKDCGTNADHFQEFLRSIMDILDGTDLTGMYLLMDNASIHGSKALQEMVQAHGYGCVYLPPYSPFLNPIEECWAKMKSVLDAKGYPRLIPSSIKSKKPLTR